MIYDVEGFIFICLFFVVAGIIVTCLLINENTRKKTLKILGGIAIILVLFVTVGIVGFHFFKEGFFVIYFFSILDLILLYCAIFSIKETIKHIRLHKNGCCTAGIIIRKGYGRGAGGYEVQYDVDGKSYNYLGEGLSTVKKIGDKLEVLYSKENPEYACLKKTDLIASVALTVACLILLTGSVVCGYIVISEL